MTVPRAECLRKAAATFRLAALGVPVALEIGPAPEGQEVAAACDGWRLAPHGGVPAVRLRLDWAPQLAGCGEVVVTVADSTLDLRGPGMRATADLDRGEARCFLSAEYFRRPGALREQVLETLVLSLVSARDRAPFHASGFMIEDLAVLLAGHSGSGKSTLARAADDAGFQVLSDDTVYLQRVPRMAVWGWPKSAHVLSAEAPPHLPTRTRNGKLKRVVPLASGREEAFCAERLVLCILERGHAVGLRAIPPGQALARLMPLDSGFDLLPELAFGALGHLTRRGALELSLGGDPCEAIALLARSMPVLRQRALA